MESDGIDTKQLLFDRDVAWCGIYSDRILLSWIMGAGLDKDFEQQEFNYLVPPAIIQPLHRASENALTLKELDDLERDTGPTLKTFLAAVNMERLEYRLRLIGKCCKP